MRIIIGRVSLQRQHLFSDEAADLLAQGLMFRRQGEIHANSPLTSRQSLGVPEEGVHMRRLIAVAPECRNATINHHQAGNN